MLDTWNYDKMKKKLFSLVGMVETPIPTIRKLYGNRSLLFLWLRLFQYEVLYSKRDSKYRRLQDKYLISTAAK